MKDTNFYPILDLDGNGLANNQDLEQLDIFNGHYKNWEINMEKLNKHIQIKLTVFEKGLNT